MSSQPTGPEYPLDIGTGDDPRDGIRGSDFVQVVRRMDALNPGIPRIGKAVMLRDEKVRFRQVPHLMFAPSTLARMTNVDSPSGKGTIEELMVYFMGLLGPSGPLPGVYSDAVLARGRGVPHPDLPNRTGSESIHRADSGPAAFIDQFNHRFISFFYRASVAADKAVDFDRPAESRFHHFIGSLFGLGMEVLQNRMKAPDVVGLFFAGHFSCPTRHPEGLCSIIGDFCRVKARMVPNIGHWVEIPSGDVTKLGCRSGAGKLGLGAILGSRFWDRTMKFRLVLGPMGFSEYVRLSPGSPGMEAVRSLVLLYTGYELGCEIQLILRKNEIPGLRLGGGLALGFSTWLRSSPAAKDADSFIKTIT